MAEIAVDGTRLSCGGIVRASQTTVTANGTPVLRVDDLADPHDHGDNRITDERMASGAGHVSANGKAVCRTGDVSNYGKSLQSGEESIVVG